MARPDIQQLVVRTVEKAYNMGGNVEEKWTRAHNMMRSVLLAETAKARKKDTTAILEARGHLEIIRKKVVRHGLTPDLQAQREAKQKELLRLERPEIKPNDPETAKRMADQSDKCTRAMFQSYKGVASQQWINEMKVALEWKDGHEPSYSWGGREVNKTTHAKQVPGAIRDYYQMLFAEKEYDSEASRRLLSEIGKTQITSAARKQLDKPKPISDQEIQDVMEALPTGKQAGPDKTRGGISSPFWCSAGFETTGLDPAFALHLPTTLCVRAGLGRPQSRGGVNGRHQGGWLMQAVCLSDQPAAGRR
jgi:hypothetical protein